MGVTRFSIMLCVILCVFALTVSSHQSSTRRSVSRPRKDNGPGPCSCPVQVTGCNDTVYRQLSSELEDTRRQLQATTDKTSISTELEETRLQVEQLEVSVVSSQDLVSSEFHDIRQQLGELKTSVSAVLDALKDTLPVEEFFPSNATWRTEKASALNNKTFPMDISSISDATERNELVTTPQADTLDKDCSEVLASGVSTSGVYTVQPLDSGEAFRVYCDMETDGGGWTVFQRRQDGSEDFYLDFASYSRGFGNLLGEFWLGNDYLHRLTAQGEYELRVDLTDFVGSRKYALYDSFSIAGVENNYTLKVRGYSGTAGDSMRLHNNRPFSTKDRDLDGYSGNCAKMFHGAWWYNACHSSNLNGEYLGGLTAEFSRGVNWKSWKGFLYSLKTAEMKIRMKQ
ncbi:ficolin-1-like [Asterias amurensis]|uniref:ficolin-1-like n=1 Tax=Asterias amurensis TaxID=7602 RepID=UPI003AB60D4D